MRIGSLFSGVGGLELGLERAGVGEVVWQCEIDLFCRQVLAKHWPNAERFRDVTEARRYPAVDLICGGFPCQDVSSAGKRAGLAGAKSGLWYSFAGVVEQVRPRFVVVENVASGKSRWLPQVRRDLHVLGYDTRAFSLSAEEVGAPHIRRRIFVVADSHRFVGGYVQQREPGRWSDRVRDEGEADALLDGGSGSLADSDRKGKLRRSEAEQSEGGDGASDSGGAWASESGVRRVANGVPDRVDRLRCLGNAVVPQCAEVIGRIIMEAA